MVQTFNLQILEKLTNNKYLLGYYEVFNNFDLQMSLKNKNIYNMNLNAKDAWSYLILKFANHNINFINSCKSDESKTYEIDSGKTKYNETSNFFQLLKNLLSKIDYDTWTEQIQNANESQIKSDSG
jgi:hypothetical protein